ncbi:MAG: Asp23/Gls24 family envelope stress response protein [Victivallaceae bacterium]|nr:Asp23/Gls24 family envelope stress response protein [Victivallaceae bacterium]
MKTTTQHNADGPAKERRSEIPGGDSQLGSICLHDNVIANLVRRAALGVPGVSRLAGNSIVDNLAELVGSRRMQDRAIAILKDSDDASRVVIELKVNVFFGFKLHEVAEQIQRAVIELVENTASVTVTAVNVAMQEIEDQTTAEGQENEEA